MQSGNNNYNYYYKKRRKKVSKYEDILKEWYGEKRSKNEIVQYLPKPVKLNTLATEIINKSFGPSESRLIQLTEQWEKIIGTQIANVAKPVSFKNKTLYIEVENSIWLMELKNTYSSQIKDKVNQFCGKGFCKYIYFVLKGRNKPKNNY